MKLKKAPTYGWQAASRIASSTHAKSAQPQPNERRHEAAALVVDDLRRAQSMAMTAGYQFAGSRGQDVLHPVGFDAIGEGNHVAVRSSEDVHRRAVRTLRPAPGVDDDSEAGKPARRRPRQTVCDIAVEPRHPSTEARFHANATGQRMRIGSPKNDFVTGLKSAIDECLCPAKRSVKQAAWSPPVSSFAIYGVIGILAVDLA
jgi:hypothetical protein